MLAAREKGRDVAVHAHGSLGIVRAARAGARSIEHASMMDDEAIAAVRKSGTFLVMNPVTNLIMGERGGSGGYTSYQLQKSREVYIDEGGLAEAGGGRPADRWPTAPTRACRPTAATPGSWRSTSRRG